MKTIQSLDFDNTNFLVFVITLLALCMIFVLFVTYMIIRSKATSVKSIFELVKSIHSEKSSASWLRWASSYVLFSTFVLAYYQQYANGTVQETLIISLVAMALTGKIAQKYVELKNYGTKSKTDDETNDQINS